MTKGKYANEPLLFIHQTKLSHPKAPMQEHFISKSIKDIKEKKEQKEVPEFRAKKVEEETEESTPKAETGKKSRKQFKDMNIRERVEHFTNMSPYAPKMRCEVKTTKNTFRGLIMDFKEGIVIVQSGKRMNEVPFEEIEDIRLIGF